MSSTSTLFPPAFTDHNCTSVDRFKGLWKYVTVTLNSNYGKGEQNLAYIFGGTEEFDPNKKEHLSYRM